MRRAATLVLVTILAAACGGMSTSAATSWAAETRTSAEAETPDATRTAAMQDNIVVLFAEEPRPDWCEFLVHINGKTELAVFDTAAWVAAKPGITPDLADSMCRDIASVVFDDNAKPRGIQHVHVGLLSDACVT
jgi:hypothetical protein